MPSTEISASELATYSVVATITRWIDGKASLSEILGASRHPKMRVLRAFVHLIEVADAAATTLTVTLYNGASAMTDTLTFTQGTETLGDVKAFTLVSNMDVVEAANGLFVTTAGTTTTLGEVEIHIQYEITK